MRIDAVQANFACAIADPLIEHWAREHGARLHDLVALAVSRRVGDYLSTREPILVLLDEGQVYVLDASGVDRLQLTRPHDAQATLEAGEPWTLATMASATAGTIRRLARRAREA